MNFTVGFINNSPDTDRTTRNMTEKDKDYAISFALPSDADGIKYIYGRHSSDLRKTEGEEMDMGNPKYSGQESLVVFDEVFVPWERVFLYKDYRFASDLVEKFSSYHRQSYSCKAGVVDVLIGATSKIAEYNGVRDSSHIQDKLVEMNHLNETIHSCSLACAYEGKKTDSGTYYVDPIKSNICKLNVTRFPYRLARLATDIAGGLLATLPSQKDYENPETKPYIKKYLRGKHNKETKNRMKILRLIENLTIGTGANFYLCESVHGAGSPMAQKLMISRLENMNEKENAAENITNIKED